MIMTISGHLEHFDELGCSKPQKGMNSAFQIWLRAAFALLLASVALFGEPVHTARASFLVPATTRGSTITYHNAQGQLLNAATGLPGPKSSAIQVAPSFIACVIMKGMALATITRRPYENRIS
jgi:hypothetical protein